jgi:hypothetical protein
MQKGITHTIKELLSNRMMSIAIVLFSIIGRFIQLLFFYNIRFDASYQVIATKNMLAGHGLSINKVFVDDLSSVVYEPLVSWPPGYSLLLSPFYAIFGHNYVAAGLTLDCIAALILVLVSRAILKELGVSIYLRNCWTLVSGFFIYYFYFIASSDAIAISFFLVAILYSIRLMSKNAHPMHIIGIILPLTICALLKYLFIPVVFILPAFLVFRGLIDRNRRLRNAGAIVFGATAIACCILLIYQQTMSGRVGYISEPGRGFFPGHLLSAYPVIPGSFLKPETLGVATGHSSDTGSVIYRIFQMIHLFLAFYLFFFTARLMVRKGLRRLTVLQSFFYLVLLLSLGIFVLLATLSIFVPKEEILPGYLWTYVEDARYYGLATVLLQLAAIACFQFYRHRLPILMRVALPIFLLFLGTEVLRGILFDTKRVALYGKEEYSWQFERKLENYADSLLKSRPAAISLVAGPVGYINNRVSIHSSVPVLSDTVVLNHLQSAKTLKDVQLLVILDEPSKQYFHGFLSDSSKQLAGEFRGFYFYTVYVKPH